MMGFDGDYFLRLDGALRGAFGTPVRRPCRDLVAALVRGILSQNTNDLNRDRAFERLRQRFPRWEDVLSASVDELADAIRPAGLSRQRAERIKGLLRWLGERTGGRISADFLLACEHEKALELLTSIPGIGIKTAAVFLLFCGGAPLFPVDTHIRRIMVRLGVFPPKTTAEKMIKKLSAVVPPRVHFSLHINLITLGRRVCRARGAECDRCPIRSECKTGFSMSSAPPPAKSPKAL